MDILHSHIPKKLIAKTQTLMLHALGFVSGDPSIRIDYPYVFHPGLQVRVTEPGDSKWIYMMLPIARGSLITDIKIAYHRTGLQSRITLVRLVEQREPVAATVVHNEVIGKTVPSRYVIGSACQVVVNRSILLKMCMDFTSTDDMIELGSVEISYIPDYVSLPGHRKHETRAEHRLEGQVESLVGESHSLNMHRPSLLEFLFKHKREIQVSKRQSEIS